MEIEDLLAALVAVKITDTNNLDPYQAYHAVLATYEKTQTPDLQAPESILKETDKEDPDTALQ